MIKKLIFFFFLTNYLHGGSHSFIFENDAITGTDRHYTNGFYYTWMSEDNDEEVPNWLNLDDEAKDNMAFSISHLMFTPEDLSDSNVILDDIPYAGYLNISYFLYQSTPNYFHEVGIGFGAVGPITHAKELQEYVHKINGNREPKGWNNQLKNDYMINGSYQFGYKTDKRKLWGLDWDWTNHTRVDLGKFYTGALIGTSFRFGSRIPDNFKTTGNFLGGEESALLNFSKSEELTWSISLGVSANAINRFYITDEYEKYELDGIDYSKARILTFNIYYQNFEFALKLRSTKFKRNEDLEDLDKDSISDWGALTFRWKFDKENKEIPIVLEENTNTKDLEEKEDTTEEKPLQKDAEESTILQ